MVTSDAVAFGGSQIRAGSTEVNGGNFCPTMTIDDLTGDKVNHGFSLRYLERDGNRKLTTHPSQKRGTEHRRFFRLASLSPTKGSDGSEDPLDSALSFACQLHLHTSPASLGMIDTSNPQPRDLPKTKLKFHWLQLVTCKHASGKDDVVSFQRVPSFRR